MNNLIIGSTAIKHYYPEFPRECRDLDIVVAEDRRNEDGKEYLKNPVILKYQSKGYLDPDLMLTLKISHLFWDINWDKHLFDALWLLNKGHEYDLEIMRELRSYWETVHPKVRRSKLEQGKDEFFSNSVNKDIEEHDFLHTLIADVPAYTKILKDGAEVELDENKWNNLSFEEKCEVVIQEACIMSWERYHGKLNYIRAYNKQLKDNIRKHYPEFIALFSIENYPILEKPKYNHFKIIENGLLQTV